MPTGMADGPQAAAAFAGGLLGGPSSGLDLGRELGGFGIGGGMGGFGFGGGMGGFGAAQLTTATTGATASGTTSTSTSTTTTTATPTTDPVAQAFQTLQSDLQIIHDKSQVTPAELAAVRKDLASISSQATTPADATKLQTLNTDAQNLNGQLPTDAQKSQLEADFTAVLQSEGITDSNLISQTITDIETVIQSTNITASDLATIATDQKAIQAALPSTATTTSSSGGSSTGGANPVVFPGGPMRGRFGMGQDANGIGMQW